MKIEEEVKVTKYIEYDGIRFYQDKKGYWMSKRMMYDGKARTVRLHVYVWEKYNGKIPDGYHVHHKDHDRSNNEIDNLELIEKHEHLRMHGFEQSEWARQNMLKNAMPAAKEWHHSEAGRAWHSEHGKRVAEKQRDNLITLTCQVCGKEYQTIASQAKRSKYCSNRCKSQARRDKKVDNTMRVCPICGKEFSANKYSPAKYCSEECRFKALALYRHSKDIVSDS